MKRIKLFFAASALVVAAAAAFASTKVDPGDFYYYDDSIDEYVLIEENIPVCPVPGDDCYYQSYPVYMHLGGANYSQRGLE